MGCVDRGPRRLEHDSGWGDIDRSRDIQHRRARADQVSIAGTQLGHPSREHATRDIRNPAPLGQVVTDRLLLSVGWWRCWSGMAVHRADDRRCRRRLGIDCPRGWRWDARGDRFHRRGPCASWRRIRGTFRVWRRRPGHRRFRGRVRRRRELPVARGAEPSQRRSPAIAAWASSIESSRLLNRPERRRETDGEKGQRPADHGGHEPSARRASLLVGEPPGQGRHDDEVDEEE